MVHILPTDALGEILNFFVPSLRGEGDPYSLVVMHINQKFKALVEARKPSWKKFYITNKPFLGQILRTRQGLEWCISQGYKRDAKSTFDIIAQAGNLELLQYAAKTLKPVIWNWSIAALKTAITYKHLELVKWITEEVGSEDSEAMAHAVGCGDIETVKWMMNNGYKFNYSHFTEYGLFCGNLEFVKWVIEVLGIPLARNHQIYSFTHIGTRSLQVLGWLMENHGVIIDTLTFSYSSQVSEEMIDQVPEKFYKALLLQAIHTDNLPVFRRLRQLLETGEAMTLAVQSNAITILRWMIVERSDYDHLLHSLEFSLASLEILKLLEERGVKFDYSKILRYRIHRIGRDFELIKWIYTKEETPLHKNLCLIAVNHCAYHTEAMIWMIEQGFDFGGDDLGNSAAKWGNTEMLAWLVKHKGYVVNWKTAYHAVVGDQLETLMWLFDNGCEFNERVFESPYISLEILKWAYSQGVVPKFSSTTYTKANLNGSFELLLWLKGKC